MSQLSVNQGVIVKSVADVSAFKFLLECANVSYAKVSYVNHYAKVSYVNHYTSNHTLLNKMVPLKNSAILLKGKKKRHL